MMTVDEYNQNILDNAAYYGVSLFLGNGQHDAYTTKTLAEAREVGEKMVAHHNNGRKPLIYAITKSGSATLVTN
jgi:hypothetical protein